MRRVSVGLVVITVMMMGAAAEQPVSPERPRPPGEGDRSPEAGQADAERGRWGTFQGHIRYHGRPPTPNIIADPDTKIARRDHRGRLVSDAPPRRLRDFEVIARRGAPIRSERLLIDPETQGVRNALIYLVQPSAVREEARKATPKTLHFRADRGVFVPHVLAAMQGTEIQVSTDDSAVYHLRSQLPGTEFLVDERDTLPGQPGVQSHEGINTLFGNFPEGRRITLNVRPTARKPRPLPVSEDLHTWMSAWWLILDHPYFAVTDERGAFEIHDVPVGPQRVIVWQESVEPSGKVFEGEIVIRDDAATVRDFVIEPE